MQDKNLKSINALVDEETYERIENYWHEAHYKSRSDAVRVLIKTGLSELENKNRKKVPGPTEKQVKYVKAICQKKKIAPPSTWSAKAYSEFIEKNK